MRHVILDTDIGTDVDYLLALVFLAHARELSLKGVTTVYGDTLLRAIMFLVCPVDANCCLVGKWRTNIHKHLIAVRLEPQKARWQLVIESCTVCS